MLKLFERIAIGDLRPHLIDQKNGDILDKLLKVTLQFEDDKFTILDNEYYRYCINEGQIIELDINEDNPQKSTIKVKSDNKLQDLINLDIPPPPNDISEKYLTIIEQERTVIKYKLNEIIKEAKSIKDIELSLLKHIYELKELTKSIALYISTLKGEHGNLFTDEKEHFVCYALKHYLVDCILDAQQIGSTFFEVKIEDEKKLRAELLGEFWLLEKPYFEMDIIAHLPKEEAFNNFKENYWAEEKKNNHKKGKLTRINTSPPIAERIFNAYKANYSLLGTKEQLKAYDNAILYWDKILITGKLKSLIGNYKANKEQVTNILIPLLKREIKSIESNNSIKKTTNSGFSTTLTNTQITNLYTQLNGKYISCSQYDFEAMFTNKPSLIHWTKNKALLAYFIYDMFQKDNPDNFWSIAESIFVDNSNTPHKSLRQSFQTAYNNKNKEPKNYQELKNIYMHLL